jgi:site-specific DNA-methyltransferase (adenine-specific)
MVGTYTEEKMNLQVEYVPIDVIKPYENNAKLHPQEQIEQIKKSIEEFGFDDPIAIWKDPETNEDVIVEGHGRLIAAQELGFEAVPIIRLDHLTDEQRRAYMLVHNKLTMNTDFDLDILDLELEDLELSDIDMSMFGFELIAPEELPEVTEDEVPEPPAEPKTKMGDIYEMGGHRLICGDSTDIGTIERLMDGAKADLLLTDPPYNVDYEGKTKDALKIQNDKMQDDQFRQFLRDAFATADTVMRDGACFYIWHADSEGYNFRGACHDIGWDVRECLIWNKNSMVLGRQDYQWKHEPCLYGWKSGAGHTWTSDRKQTTVIDMNRPSRSEMHPTMKPIGLFAYLIGNNTKKGDIVLDTFGGSGTTIMACEQLGRRGYVCELDPKYCDVIIERWESFTGKKAVLVNEG